MFETKSDRIGQRGLELATDPGLFLPSTGITGVHHAWPSDLSFFTASEKEDKYSCYTVHILSLQ